MKGVRGTLLAAVALAAATAAGCGGGEVQEGSRPGADRLQSVSGLRPEAKARLARRRIFFGHQSVGSNIMDGVATLAREDAALGLRVVDVAESSGLSGGFFAHGPIGRNGDPSGKTDDFAARMDGALGSQVDVAFHKYCYIDIDERSDAEALFSHYREAMARLKAEHPGITFVHVTTPLTHVQDGPKVLVKKLIGRAPGGYAENLRRERFNDLMRREYQGREPLFDLALVEATLPGGGQETFSFQGNAGRALHPPYGSDGRHLNDRGRRWVAGQLLVTLASLPVSSPAEETR